MVQYPHNTLKQKCILIFAENYIMYFRQEAPLVHGKV